MRESMGGVLQSRINAGGTRIPAWVFPSLAVGNKTRFYRKTRAGLNKLDKDYNTSTKWRVYASWGVMTLLKIQCMDA
jgi:hypothetical protein